MTDDLERLCEWDGPLLALEDIDFEPVKIAHGTVRGYRAHRRHGVPPCDACKRANADYKNEITMRRKQRESA